MRVAIKCYNFFTTTSFEMLTVIASILKEAADDCSFHNFNFSNSFKGKRN